MDLTRKFLVLSLVIAIATSVQGQKKYTDGNRPYEFGFKIDGEQHRQEKKDENGIIMGEFGYITGDGIYHVTVFATDENGNYKVLSMKHIRVGPSPWGPAKQKTPAVTTPPPPPPTTQAPQTSTRGKLDGKPGCSGCLIPTPPPPPPPRQPAGGSTLNSPGSSPPLKANAPVKFPGTPGFPSSGQSPQGGSFPSSPGGSGGNGPPFGGKYPATAGAPGSGQNSPAGSFPPSGRPGFDKNPPGGKFPATPGLSDPTQFPNRGQFPGSSSGQSPPGSQQGQKPPGKFPGSSSGQSPPGQFPSSQGGLRPTSPSGSFPAGPGGQNPSSGQRPIDGLPPGLTVDDVTGLLYKFNYTVGFHGHNEQGYRNGDKEGEYNANYRDGLGTIVTYVANEQGYQPKVKFVKLSNEETPRAETEKEYGLKGYEFKWFNRR